MNSQSPHAERPDRRALFRNSEFALHSLRGPRSLLFPCDPQGERQWLDPFLSLRVNVNAGRWRESFILFVTSNEPDDPAKFRSPTVLRHASWDAAQDTRKWRNKEPLSAPSLTIAFHAVTDAELAPLHALVCELQRAIGHLPFPVEGLERGDDCDTPHLSPGETSDDYVQYAMSCSARFWNIELSWSPINSVPTALDNAAIALRSRFSQLSSTPGNQVEMIDRYDIDPRTLASLVN